MENKQKSTIIKDAVALCIITLVAAVALAFVNEITKGPIAEAAAKAKAEAYVAVFEEAQLVDDQDEALNAKVEASADFLAEKGFTTSIIDEVCVAKDASGNALGYVMTLTSTAGYGGNIKFTMGVKSTGAVTKIEILEISETKGLGLKATEPEFKDQFNDVKADSFNVIKTDAAKSSDADINAISGASITSNAVTGTVNAGVAFINELLNEGIGGVVRE